jgi:hypothetical protein
MVPPPKRQLRWGRLSFAILLLIAIIGSVGYLVASKLHHA